MCYFIARHIHPAPRAKGRKVQIMKAQVRRKLQSVGFLIIRKRASGNSKTGRRMIFEVLPSGKLHIIKTYETKEERDSAFDEMLLQESVLAG